MLVLTRVEGEQIVLLTSDGEIVITLHRVVGLHKAKIGIEAPAKVAVHRKEVLDRMPEQQRTIYGQMPIGQ